jgi:pyruvate dehydrogenase E2 component (dihydrolipoamide acetyltransferase)
MLVDIVMPKMGESLQEGTITKWLKKPGDAIERDEMILEISTDKVDTEVPAPQSGVLKEVLAEEGDTVEVGSVIAKLETDATTAGNTTAEEPEKAEQKEEVPAEEPTESNDDESDGGDVTEVVMPKMGESLQEGTIIKWLKKPGDTIERDEMILEISTDKVDTEVPAPIGGILIETLAEEGDTVEVGTPIAKISGSGKSPKKKSAPKSVEQKSEESSKPSQTNQKETASEITVPASGGTTEIPPRKDGNFYSPLVRKISKEEGVTLEELEQLKGSGVQGRITKDDLLKYIEDKKAGKVSAAKPEPKVQATPAKEEKSQKPLSAPKSPQISHATGDDVEVIPMDRIRQLISEHMVYSKHTSAHVTSVAEADVTEIVKYREKHKAEFMQREGFKLTFTPFFAKAAIDAIKKHPMVNVSVDGKNILRHRKIHLGMATALPDGNLIVPVIKNSEVLNITGLARSVYDLADRARSKKLNPDDIQGGTFTITNVGTFGTLFGTPVINQPQTGIFGVGAIKKRPVVKEVEGNDLILVRHMMYVSITYDHRVIDGMLAGQTLAEMVRSLENMNENTLDL